MVQPENLLFSICYLLLGEPRASPSRAIKQNPPAYAEGFCLIGKKFGRFEGPKSCSVRSEIFIGLAGGGEVLFRLVPIHRVPPGLQIVGSPILIEKVIGVFPDIDTEDRF